MRKEKTTKHKEKEHKNLHVYASQSLVKNLKIDKLLILRILHFGTVVDLPQIPPQIPPTCHVDEYPETVLNHLEISRNMVLRKMRN